MVARQACGITHSNQEINIIVFEELYQRLTRFWKSWAIVPIPGENPNWFNLVVMLQEQLLLQL